jgi:hypothetical protein
MNNILIDNRIALLNGSNDKKFNLNQAKIIWFILGKINEYVVSKKYQNKLYANDTIIDCEMSEDDIDIIEIDKIELRKACFNYNLSNKRLYDLVKSTQMAFEFTEEKRIFNFYQDLNFTEDNIITLYPTNTICKMLHCKDNHFCIKLDEILKCSSVNTVLFYQWIKSKKYLIEKYKKKLLIMIDDLKNFFITNRKSNDFIRDIINPSIVEYNSITGEKIKFQTIKAGTKISQIQFSI